MVHLQKYSEQKKFIKINIENVRDGAAKGREEDPTNTIRSFLRKHLGDPLQQTRKRKFLGLCHFIVYMGGQGRG